MTEFKLPCAFMHLGKQLAVQTCGLGDEACMPLPFDMHDHQHSGPLVHGIVSHIWHGLAACV